MMEAISLDELAARLEVLERKAKRLERALVVALVGLLGLAADVVLKATQDSPAFAAQAPVPTHIRARSFAVVDAHGVPRILLGTDGDGAAMVALSDRKGNLRADLVVRDEDRVASFEILDRNQRARIVLGVEAEGSIGSNQILDDRPTFLLADPKGASYVTATVGPEANPGISLAGPSGKGRMYFGFIPGGVPVIDLTDRGGNPVWSAH